MNTCKRLLLLTAMLLFSTIAFAQSSTITVGSGSGLPGEVVTLDVTFTAGTNEIAGVDMDLVFDDSLYSSVTVPAGCGATAGGTFNSCSVAGDTVNIANAGLAAFTDGILATVTFTIANSATPGDDTLLTGTVNSLSDPQAQAPDPSTVPVVQGVLTVTAGPQPVFNGVAAGLTMNAAQEGDANPTGSVTITNTGSPATTLTGTCSLTGPDAAITLTNGAFSVAQGSAGAAVAVACDASAEGSYTNTVSCTHNGTNASPVTYPVTCEVGPAGAASYISTPAIGSTIEMTPEDVPTDTAVADQVLTINNGASDPADNDLILTNCGYTGDAAITVGAAPASPIAPNGSSSTTFSCDTSVIGDYNGTYSCDYSVDNGATSSTASYPVHCGVRAAGSEVDVTPGPGVVRITVPVNGTGFAAFTFSEVLNEGVDATVDSCTLADGSAFVITTGLPLTIPAGGSVQIQVQGTDPADGSFGATDVLTCQITDSTGTSTGSWDLELTVQTAAIPTLSTWGLLAMFLAMLGFGGIVIRRKSSN